MTTPIAGDEEAGDGLKRSRCFIFELLILTSLDFADASSSLMTKSKVAIGNAPSSAVDGPARFA